MTATNHEDPFITGYRDHGLALAKGMSPNAAMAELKNQVSTLSIEIAEKVLKSELANTEAQTKLVEKMLGDAKLN